MNDMTPDRRGVRVPTSRLSRLARMGSMAGGVAGGAAMTAARQMAGGQRPDLGSVLMTPANAARLARELAHLRGAAMKMGQLLSMEAGDLLPRELSDILARLRSDAEPMPPQQLRTVLDKQWGKGWLGRFERFDPRPIAAASIGQVHRARLRDGRDLAIKVQYPGVRRSIDSDLRNVAGLLRLARVLPETLDIDPLLEEARRQLHEEADYEREGHYLDRFGHLLRDDDAFRVPALCADFTTAEVLAMDFIDGRPVESLTDAPQAERDRAVEALLQLVLRELFDFGLMQTDPNFANYRIETGTGRLALLDFGAAQPIKPRLAEAYRALVRASLDGDRGGIHAGLLAIEVFDEHAMAQHEPRIEGMIDLALQALNAPPPFDFSDRSVALRLRDEGLAIAADRSTWRLPPADMLLVQRKMAGMYLLATRLGARLDLRALIGPWVQPVQGA